MTLRLDGQIMSKYIFVVDILICFTSLFSSSFFKNKNNFCNTISNVLLVLIFFCFNSFGIIIMSHSKDLAILYLTIRVLALYNIHLKINQASYLIDEFFIKCLYILTSSLSTTCSREAVCFYFSFIHHSFIIFIKLIICLYVMNYCR